MNRITVGFSLLLAIGLSTYASSAPIVTTTFQHGVSGYTDVADRRIGPGYAEVNGSAVNTDASSYFIDGGNAVLNDTGFSNGLIRFDNIIGGAGIPAGAKILSSTVDLVTGSTSAAQSGGAINVYRLKTAFDGTSTNAGTFGGNGIAGDVGEILGSFDGIAAVGNPSSARIDQAMQYWADGGTNLGLGIRSDQSIDAWSPHTTGSATVAKRPKLTVTYTTDPLVQITSYQQGVNSYSGTTDLRFDSGTGSATDGSTTDQIFLDGYDPTLATPSPDQSYLVKFAGLDLNFPATYRAELVIKTGFASTNADSPGPFTVHQVLKDWSLATTYASLDSNSDPTVNGPVELQAGGMIAPAAASVTGINDTEVMYIDVTSIVENWRAGQPNYGFYIGTANPTEGGTSNGWQIFLTGAGDSSFRPELRIIGVPEPAAATLLLAGAALMFSARRRLSR
jgi:hypothetical protein